MPRGGARKNSGPQKGAKYAPTLEKQALRQVVYDFVAKNMGEILEGLLHRARGCKTLKEINNVGIVFDLPPDPTAAKILIEHGIGKPLESVEMSGKDGGPLEIKWEE